ncbi:MAG: ATP-binding cassette domain-containing protein [Lachnospiraceae bacterium]|nr:ATP-binding cassette domain-containing protein [Lachnospiraceae bacterium]
MRIEFKNVSKTYEDTQITVFDHLNLQIDKGELILLTGKSGSGKSTLIKLLLMETRPSEGSILVGQHRLENMTDRQIPHYRRKLGVVFQEGYLIGSKSVYENVALARQVTGSSGKDIRKAISSMFSFLGIGALYKRYPGELSGGEKQKVCLARALMNYPALLLADEPVGNLSAGESEEIMGMFELICRQGTTVVIATHNKESAKGINYREIAL